MAIASVNPVAVAAAAKSGKADASATNPVSATENRFLALLVAQMRNQDPLNPLDNAQVTSQMAQLSTVQGVNQMNLQLSQLLSEFQGLQAMTLAGRSVLVPGNRLALATPAGASAPEARGGLELAAEATSVRVLVKNPAGQVVRTLDLGARAAGVSSFTWDGLSDAGTALAAGNYTFTVAATANGQAVPSQGLARARVEGVNRTAAGIELDLGTLGRVSYGEVLQVI